MEYLKIFTDFTEIIDPLEDDERGRLFTAMLEYAKTGRTPLETCGNERFVWPVARQIIDREAAFLERQAANGAKGGRPKKSQEEATETQENPKKPTETQKTHKDKDKDKDKDNDNILRESKHKYGRYKNVLLTDGEMEALQREFPNDWAFRVERLSEYIAQMGKTYKNHLATIRAWSRKDREEQKPDGSSWMKKYIQVAK